MKRDFGKSIVLIFSVMLTLLLFACQNPFLVDATKLYKASFETNCDTKIDSYRTSKIESEPKVTKTDYVFDGWYTNKSCNGDPITFPYELSEDTTFYAKWESIYCTIIYYEGETELASKTVLKGSKLTDEQITKHLSEFEIELEKTRYVFDAWYASKDFSESSIVLPFEVESDIKLYARWIDEHNILTFTSNADITGNNGYADGVLTIASNYEKVIFKDFQSTNLSIELSNPNIKVVLDNFSFSSSKGSLIDSSSDFLIEYKGDNILSSSASSAVPLIKGSGRIEIRGNDKSKLELQPNTVTDSTDGSIGVKASEVIISSGNFVIKGSDGWNNSTEGRNGGNGSTGIKANVVIKNNAVVTIAGGNGASGNKGVDGKQGDTGVKREWVDKSAGDGGKGYTGETGGNGGKGGNAISGELEVESGCNVILTAGNGGNGGNGGKGGKGGTGGGNSAPDGSVGNGGDGGTGGQGGNGGNGGDAISGEPKSDIVSIKITKGIGGLRGEGGDGGDPGDVGTKDPGWSATGNPHKGNYGSPGAPGENGQDGVEHR